jgi:predicted DNA binding CopG/RHH family protein
MATKKIRVRFYNSYIRVHCCREHPEYKQTRIAYAEIEKTTRRMFTFSGEKLKMNTMKKALSKTTKDEMINLNNRGRVDDRILHPKENKKAAKREESELTVGMRIANNVMSLLQPQLQQPRQQPGQKNGK